MGLARAQRDPQGLAFAQQVPLPDHFLDGLGAQAFGEGGRRPHLRRKTGLAKNSLKFDGFHPVN
jgi:hypothetical protein